MKKETLTDYYFFEGKFSKIPYNEVRKLKKEESFSLKNKTITIKVSSEVKKKTKRELVNFCKELLLNRKKTIKETIMDVSMLFDVRIAYRIKCGKEVILFIKTP